MTRKESKKIDPKEYPFCGCVHDFKTWVKHNIDSLMHLYSEYIVDAIASGSEIPPPEAFEVFCLVTFECVRDIVVKERYGRTVH